MTRSTANNPLLITDASTQFHQLCQINSESPNSNDLTQRMLPYANVDESVRLWILQDMMQSTPPEPIDSSDNTLKEHLHLPHEILFEIIKYIPIMDNQDKWVTYFKYRLISSSIKQHAEREIITIWNREGLNLSRFLYSHKSNTSEKNAKFQILAKLFQVYNETTNHQHEPSLPEEEPMENDDLSPQDDDDNADSYDGSITGSDSPVSVPEENEEEPMENDDLPQDDDGDNAGSFYGSITGADSSPVSEEDDEAMEDQFESVDEIMQELDGRAVKDFTIPEDDHCKLKKRRLDFYKNGLNHLIPNDVQNAPPPVEFSNNDSIKVLILPITDRLDINTNALVASLKALETLHIIYYGKTAEFLLQQFTYCHANTIKLTMLSPLSCTEAIFSLGTRYDCDLVPYHSKVDLNCFPNLVKYHMEGTLSGSFSIDEINYDEDVKDLPSMEFYVVNKHVGSYSSLIKADQPLQIYMGDILDWKTMIHSGIYVNPFHMSSGITRERFQMNFERRDSLMGRILLHTQLSLSEKKQFIEDVMRHPGQGYMSACRDMSISHNCDEDDEEKVTATPLERKCLIQWSIYCINKYRTYKLFDTKLLHQFVDEKEQKLLYRLLAQCVLYGWDPQYNLLEALVVGASSQKLSQPLMEMVEEKFQSDSDAFSLKSIQLAIGILLKGKKCLEGIQLIELVKKYHMDGCDLFKPDVRNGRGLLHLIFCMDLPMIVMEKILQLVTPDDLLYVMDIQMDKVTVLTIGLYSHELTNEFLLKLIEKQPMLAHLPTYDDPTTHPIAAVEPPKTTKPIYLSEDNSDDLDLDPSDDNSESSEDLYHDELRGKRSLLHYVVGDIRRWELIPILVEKYGCDLNVQDLSGRTPRDVALLLLNDLHLSLDCLPPCLH